MLKLPVATKKGGIALTTGPTDTCKIPAPPAPFAVAPFPNIARVNGTSGACTKVVASNKPIVVQNSKVSRSMGDEAGTLKGVMSQQNMGKCKFKKYSSKVYAKGKKVVTHTAMTAQNAMPLNIVGVHAVPSQTKVLATP